MARKGNRAFNAHRKGIERQQDLKTVTFLGQQFIIANQSGGKRARRFDLLAPEGTELAGTLLRGVTSEALLRYRDDESAKKNFVY